MPGIKLAKNEAVKLYGPMSVTVKSGLIDIHGKQVSPGERFVVHKTRNYVALAIEESELDVAMVNESQIQSLEQDDPYLLKKKIVEEITNRSDLRLIVIIGCSDCGKTSLTTMMYNHLLRNNRKPAVIDSDVGQADIGPPGFITLGASSTTVYWINELEPIFMRFIGDIKPQGHSHLIISEIYRLVEEAWRKGYESIVIDTDGWVRDEGGILHKLHLVETLRPEAIIVLGDELKGVFSRVSKLGVSVYELPTPRHRKTRSREERRLLRSLKYKEFLENANVIKVKIDDVYIHGLPLLQGVELDPQSLGKIIDGRVLYASRIPGVICIYGHVREQRPDEQRKPELDRLRIYPIGFERSVYCSVGSRDGTDFPCIVERFDFENREIIIRTKFTGRVDVIRFSKIRLNESFTEDHIEV